MDLRQLWIRMQHVVRPATTTTDSTESGVVQTVQARVTASEVHDKISSVQQYGVASGLLSGCDILVVHVAGDNSAPVAVASNDRRYRPTGMSAGEVKLYDNNGQFVYLQSGTTIVISGKEHVNILANTDVTITANTDVTINAPTITLNGQHIHCNSSGSMDFTAPNGVSFTTPAVTMTGTLASAGDMTAGTISAQGHVHGGVQAGGANTSVPVK